MAKPRPKTARQRASAATRPAPAAKRRVARAPGTRQKRAGERRDAILLAALDEFSERGFAATRLEDVAKRAGVAKGTIYLYFHDKEQLFQEIVRAMLTPVVGSLEALGHLDMPMRELGGQIAELFIREVYETRRRDVIRLIITEGRRFPQLAEFYHRQVLSRIFAALREVLRRAAARGEAPPRLAEFPQLVGAPGLLAVIWNGLFERFAPLDVRAMLHTHLDILFGPGSKT